MRWLLLIPSYNTGGALLLRTVKEALSHAADVWVVVDGSTDGSAAALEGLHPNLRVLKLPTNQGKGAAVLHGTRVASEAGYTHVLTMDADGQHPARAIPEFVALGTEQPQAVLLGQPIFGPEAPLERVQGRKISNTLVSLETLGWGVGDCLFGMRWYPCAALLHAFAKTRYARRFDFDTEIAVRLAWMGVPMRHIHAPVRYVPREEGGISQFRYGRDNALLTWMHTRLLIGAAMRLPWLLWLRFTSRS
jgi:glycosyltransferase involved in cell wall biosynthesis